MYYFYLVKNIFFLILGNITAGRKQNFMLFLRNFNISYHVNKTKTKIYIKHTVGVCMHRPTKLVASFGQNCFSSTLNTKLHLHIYVLRDYFYVE